MLSSSHPPSGQLLLSTGQDHPSFTKPRVSSLLGSSPHSSGPSTPQLQNLVPPGKPKMETLGQVSKPYTFKNQLSLETGRLSKTDRSTQESPSPVLGKRLQLWPTVAIWDSGPISSNFPCDTRHLGFHVKSLLLLDLGNLILKHFQKLPIGFEFSISAIE